MSRKEEQARRKTWKTAELRFGLLHSSSLLESKGASQPAHWSDTCEDAHKITSFRSHSQERHPFVKWAVSQCSTWKHQRRRVGRKKREKGWQFPSFKPGVMGAATTLPPLSGLPSREWRKDQKQVEIKRIKTLKFFCFATGCHPSSTYRSARQEYSLQSKEKYLQKSRSFLLLKFNWPAGYPQPQLPCLQFGE